MADPLSITASIIAVLQLAETAAKYIKTVKSGSKARVQLRDELRSTMCLVQMIKDRFEDADGAEETALKPTSVSAFYNKDGPLVMFEKTLKCIISKLEPHTRSKQILNNITWPFDQKDINEMLATMERLKSTFSLILQNDAYALAKLQSSKIDDITQQLRSLETRDQNQERDTVLRWLSPLDYREKQASILASVEQGTGKWFIEHEIFSRWVAGNLDDDSRNMFCPGIPGAGKTRLASLAIRYLETKTNQTSTALTYIYCDYGSRDSQTSLGIVSSLLEQLFRRAQSANLPQHILDLYKLHCRHGTRPALEEVVHVFKLFASEYDTLYIVIDALDECAAFEETTLNLLEAILGLHPGIKLLCTSRHSVAFKDFFAQALKITISASKDDIRIFLRSHVHEQPRLNRHLKADPTLEDEIIESITDEAHGMFLLTKLHMESLGRKLSRKDVRYALKSLPKTLDSIYEQTLDRVHQQAHDDASLARTILLWILWSPKVVTLSQLQHMYAVRQLSSNARLEQDDLPDAQALVGVCGGLLLIDDTLQTVRMVHYTAQEFLMRIYLADLVSTKAEIAGICQRYLTLSNFSSGTCATDESMVERLNEYPFLEYAATSWGYEGDSTEAGDNSDGMITLVNTDYAIATANQAANTSRLRYIDWSQEFPRNVPGIVLVASFELPRFLERMIADGHDIQAHGTDGETPLLRSARLGLIRNVEVLLKLGADVSAVDSSGETALWRAIASGHSDVVCLLLRYTDIGTICTASVYKWTHLMLAVVGGNYDIVKMLVDAGFPVNSQTSWGESAVSLAMRNGQEDIAQYLADHGAILHQNATGRRASRIGMQHGLAKLVRRLTLDYDGVARQGLPRESACESNSLATLGEEIEDPAGQLLEGPPRPAIDHEEMLGDFVAAVNHTSGFDKKYSLGAALGRGHSATVSICVSKVTGVRYAAKIRSMTTYNKGFFEIKALTELSHHNILRYIETLLSDNTENIISIIELAPEGDLFSLIIARNRLTEQDTRNIFLQLFSALHYMHGKGWVHRDVKPENILLLSLEPLVIKLGDLDIAAYIETKDADSFLDTLCGTPSYVAPEILKNPPHRKYNHLVDVWSAGVVLYICLVGFPPFSDELYCEQYPYTLAQQIKGAKFDFPSPYWDIIGDPALELIDAMLVADPTRRRTVRECMEHPWMLAEGEI